MKKNIKDIELKNRTCLVRCDFNVHMEQGEIEDGSRIDAALPTIEYMINHDAKVVLMSHMGRPEGQADPEYSFLNCIVQNNIMAFLGKSWSTFF